MPRGDLSISVDTSDIPRKVVPFLNALPELVRSTVVVKTINRTGGMAKTAVIKGVSRLSGQRQREVREGITEHKATIQNPRYELVVQGTWLSGLMYVISQQDDRVCPQCAAAEAGGPYTPEQVEELRLFPHSEHSGRGTGLTVAERSRAADLHPNCRCVLLPAEERVREQLEDQGTLREVVVGIVAENLPRIFQAELEFAAEKLARDHGLL